ncbi:MAG TPA: trehalose-phosphatase [Acidimicrobiales bacterium]|jgi:trehalose 6-phosphate phosphatase
MDSRASSIPADLEARLAPWIERSADAGVFTDFDGTLAPIVDDPAAAAAVPGALEVLGRLARRYRRVAVISGRPVDFLAGQFGGVGGVPDGLVLIGLYGLERLEGGLLHLRDGAEAWAEIVDAVADAAERDAPAGVLVERKSLAVGLHVRRRPERLGWVEAYATEQAAATGLVAQEGKLAYELRPPLRVDKGTIVAELAAGLASVCFAGDDTGDLPAFAALGRLRAEGVATLGIAARSAESPPAVLAAADVVVDGPPGVLDVWRRLVD